MYLSVETRSRFYECSRCLRESSTNLLWIRLSLPTKPLAAARSSFRFFQSALGTSAKSRANVRLVIVVGLWHGYKLGGIEFLHGYGLRQYRYDRRNILFLHTRLGLQEREVFFRSGRLGLDGLNGLSKSDTALFHVFNALVPIRTVGRRKVAGRSKVQVNTSILNSLLLQQSTKKRREVLIIDGDDSLIRPNRQNTAITISRLVAWNRYMTAAKAYVKELPSLALSRTRYPGALLACKG